MAAYRVTMTYSSAGRAYEAGDVLELDDETAAWMQRDVPGCLEAVKAAPAPAQERAAAAPEHDRMTRGAGRTRGAR